LGIYTAPKYQVVTVILGLVAMSVGMVIVVFHGAPIKPLEEGEYHALFDLGAYLCPLLAAVCAGAGLFLHFPRIGGGTWDGPATAMPEGGEANADEDLKAYYVASLVFLLCGLLCYAFCHPCQSPNVTVISCAYMVTGTLVLRARVALAPQDSKHRWLDVRTMKVMSWVTVIGCEVAFVYIHTMFIHGQCMD